MNMKRSAISGDDFKAWRKQMGFKTQQQAADALHYSLPTVKKWESNQSPIPYLATLAMAALFHRLEAWRPDTVR